jgi:hypothetical protein
VIVVKEKTEDREALIDTYVGQFMNDQPHGELSHQLNCYILNLRIWNHEPS